MRRVSRPSTRLKKKRRLRLHRSRHVLGVLLRSSCGLTIPYTTQEHAQQVTADLTRLVQEYDQMRSNMLSQLQRKQAEVEAAGKRKLAQLQEVICLLW